MGSFRPTRVHRIELDDDVNGLMGIRDILTAVPAWKRPRLQVSHDAGLLRRVMGARKCVAGHGVVPVRADSE